jgi:hypothetical protein
MTRIIIRPILDYRPPSPDDRLPPRWLLQLVIAIAVVAFPLCYALFAIVLIVTPLLVVAAPFSVGLLALTACALTAAGTFGSLWLIDYCLARTTRAA